MAVNGEVLAAISNAMVQAKKQYYGKGPTKARTYINDDYVFVVMEDGLTANEETLLAAGEEDLVRGYRLKFQEAVHDELCGAVTRIVGRPVVTYHSQILFNPTRVFEIFVLEPEDASAPAKP
jgi:uncharacterized protein YbcI